MLHRFWTRVLILAVAAWPLYSFGQNDTRVIDGREWKDPQVGSVGRAPLRNEFMSYDTRPTAETGLREATEYYVPLPLERSARGNEQIYSVGIDIPFVWVDRDLFLHVEGMPGYYIDINGVAVAYSQDSRSPSEFMISPFVTDGPNRITIRVPEGSVGQRLEDALDSRRDYDVFLYSQPKVRIEDYNVTTTPDSSGRHMVFDLDVAVSNSYNSTEKFMVGFDIYSPEGKLEIYDIRETKVKGGGRDTVRFRELIYRAMQKRWTPESPKLYSLTVFVRRNGRILEYVPFKVGFGSVSHADGILMRNGEPQNISAAFYAGATTAKQAETELQGLKARGINTVWLSYPQSYWFYDLCDRIGMNVIDQANLNFTGDTGNPNIDGTLSNNPLWSPSFTERMLSMYHRNREHACIIGVSLGGNVGNGFNMYEGYRTLKATGTPKAVLLRDAEGYWNNDAIIDVKDAVQVLETPLPAKQPNRKK